MQIKLSNAGMQYLYSIVTMMNLNTRQAVKNVTNILDIIRPIVSLYEEQREEGTPIITGKIQILKDKIQMHEAKMRAGRIIAAGEQMTEGSVKPYESDEEANENQLSINEKEKEIDQLKEERTELGKIQVMAAFNEEQFNSLNTGLDAVLATWRDPKTGQGLSGEPDAVALNEVVAAIENAEKI